MNTINRCSLCVLLGLLREAASQSNDACTAALGLQPVIENVPEDGLFRQGDTVEVKVYAVNLCIEDKGMTTVSSLILAGQSLCIKPAAEVEHKSQQAYIPKPEYWDHVTATNYDSSMFKWIPEPPDWGCRGCDAHSPDSPACFTMQLKRDFYLPKSDLSQYRYLFTIATTLTKTIPADMAADKEVVFQAQTLPVAVQITDPMCNNDNRGGGQGSVPLSFAMGTITTTPVTATTTTTTLCEWPCCAELRNRMSQIDQVVDFIEQKFHHTIEGNVDQDTVCAEKCYAGSDTECPASTAPPPAPEPRGECTCAPSEPWNTVWMVIVSILCAVLCSVAVTTLWFQRFPAAAGERMRGAPASEPLLMH